MKQFEIWGDMIPGNSSRKKSLDMEIGKNRLYLIQLFRMLIAISDSKYKDSKKETDNVRYPD